MTTAASTGPDEHPLTFGQLSVWRIMQTYPLDHWSGTYLRNAVPLPPATSLDRVLDAIRQLCARHESLRTYFVDAGPGPRQRVVPFSGHVDVEVVDIPSVTSADATRVSHDLARERIDQATEFGRRFAVVTDRGRPAHVAMVVDHIVADGPGMYRLRRELTTALGATDSQAARWLAERPPQPRELAADQRSPDRRTRREAATGYWERLLRTLPADLFPFHGTIGATAGRVEATLHSPRARAAVERLSGMIRVPPPSVLLALTALALATVTRRSDLVLTLQSSNRFPSPWQDIVSSMNQYTPMPLSVGDRATPFAAFAVRAQAAALRAYRAGMYDIDEVTALVGRERATALDFDHFFNFLAHQVTTVGGGAPEESTPSWIEDTEPNRQVGPRFDVKVRSGPDMPIVIRTDPTLLPRERLRALLRWYDEQLQRLAQEPDRTVGDLLDAVAVAVGAVPSPAVPGRVDA